MTKSCNIGFALASEHSSYHAALGLARAVQDRGHNAIFFVSDQTVFAQLVGTHGCKVAAIPPGHEAHFAKSGKTARFRLWKRLKKRTENIRAEQDFLVDAIKANSIDLLFLDAIRADLYPFALALAKTGVPTMLLSYTFASRFGSGYPPVFSSATSPRATGTNVLFRAAHALRWAWALGTRGRGQAFGRAEYAETVVRKWLDQARNVSFERELHRFGVRSTWSEWKRRPLVPEIVFGHRMLDWPAIASDPNRFYFGTTDLFRKSPDFDLSVIDADRPVAYCNLSTINGFERIDVSESKRQGAGADDSITRFRMARRYVMAVLECFSRRPDWQLLIACGPFFQSLQAGAHAPNIHLFDRLPQLAVLERADLAITWGGAGTIRECVNHGVPDGRPSGLDRPVRECGPGCFPQRRRARRPHGGHRGEADGDGRTRTDRPDTFAAFSSEMRMQCDANQELEGLVRFVGRHAGLKL